MTICPVLVRSVLACVAIGGGMIAGAAAEVMPLAASLWGGFLIAVAAVALIGDIAVKLWRTRRA